jgi:hypothetical protein
MFPQVLIVLMACFLLWGAGRDISTVVLLRLHGAPAQASVTYRRQGTRSGQQEFRYSFVVGGIEYRGSGSWYLGPGGTLAITYLPSHPTVNAPGVGSDLRPNFVWCLGLVAAIAFLATAIKIGRMD